MTCKDCIHEDLCGTFTRPCMPDEANASERLCKDFKNKADFVEVCRCSECIHAIELDKHCELNRFAYKHCALLRGEEEINVWHKYKKYYKDYSLVESDDFCSYGQRK